MKRLLACLLVLSVLLGLAACKKSEDKKSITTNDFKDDDDEKEDNLPQAQDFEPIIIFDEPGYLVTVTNWDGNYLYLSFENRSADTTYDFDYEGCSFNGLVTDASLYCELAPGETDNDTIWLSPDYKALLGDITHIALTVSVDVDYEQVGTSTVHYYPLGEDAATAYERTPEATDETIFHNESLSVVATGYTLDRNHFKIDLFLSNPTDKTITASFGNFLIDGFLISFTQNYYIPTLLPNTCMFLKYSTATSNLQNCGIRKLEKITCDLELTQEEAEPVVHPVSFAPQNLFVAKAETNFEPVVILDKENCYHVEITNMTVGDTGAVTLQVLMENRSEFYSYSFRLEDLYANAVKISQYFNNSLAPGQKKVASLLVSGPSQDDIGDITHISATFTATNSESYTAEEVNTISLYPQGKENLSSPYRRKIKVTDHVLLDNEYLTVVATEYKSYYNGGMQVELYYYNKCEQPIYVEWENCKINGLPATVYHSFRLSGGSTYLTSDAWSGSFMTENNITQIDSVTIDLCLMESDAYNATAYFKENIELMDKPFTLTTEE